MISAFDIRAITHFVGAETVDSTPGYRLSSPRQEIACTQNCDHSFLPLLGHDGLLDLAALNIERNPKKTACLNTI